MASPALSSPVPHTPPTSAYAAWIAVCILWGTTYLGIRIALETIPPGLLGGIRFTVAGATLCALVLARGGRLPPLSEWPKQGLIGVLMLGIGNGFVVVAEQWIPSGIAAVGVASAPFWMTGLVAVTGGERLTRGALSGFLLGFGGIVILIWPELFRGGAGGALFVAGIVAGQLACVGWSIGSLLSKRWTPQGTALAASAVQQLCGGLVTLAVGTAIGEWNEIAFSARSVTAELYLIVFGSLGAYSAYLYVLQHLPIATVSLYAYVNPVIAVILGTVIASEPFNPRIIAAAVMVLAGIGVVRRETVVAERSRVTRHAEREGQDAVVRS
jgi:drug/metabolite transporter (DMT)-like permease